MTFAKTTYQSPIGPLILVARGEELQAVVLARMWPHFAARFAGAVARDSRVLAATRRQLDEYFAGKRRRFDLPLALDGTTFQKKAWRSLARIPYGKTRTYKEQAAAIGAPRAFRAVGHANGLNPHCVVLPCHRVVGSDGSLTGYAGGLAAKRFLLALEGSKPARKD